MATRRISVEVSNSAVRMAEIAVGGARPELVSVGQVGLPPKAVVDGVIVDIVAVQAALERCIKEGGFSTGGVHLGIAGLRAITREIDMPLVPDSEIDSAVRLQAIDVIPFPLEKAILSARPISQGTNAEGLPELRVLVAAAHRDLIDPLVEVVTRADLVPVSVEPTSSAMIRALYDPSAPAGGAEAIISIGAALTTVVVHENGVAHFVRTIAEGGDAITAAVAAALDLPINDAENTKRNLDQPGPHIRVAATAVRDAAAVLIAELRSSIDYYGAQPGREPVRRVVVTGGGSRLRGFVEQMQQLLRLPVVVGSALTGIDATRLGLPPEELGRLDPVMAVAIGLALPAPKDVKQLDLLPPEFVLRRLRRRTQRSVIVVAVVIVAAMAGLGVMRFLKVHDAENTVASLKTQVATLQAEIPKYDKVQREQAAILADSKVATPIVTSEVNWPAVIAALQKYVPSGGTITSFSGGGATPVAAAPHTVIPPDQQQIASLSLGILAPAGYPYFDKWYLAIDGSHRLVVTTFSGISKTGTGNTTTFTAQVGVTGLITSSRVDEFKVTP